MLAVRREGDSRHRIAHRDAVDELHLLPLDGEDADARIRAVGDQKKIAVLVDGQARRLLADIDGRDQFGGRALQIDDEKLVVGHSLPTGAVLLISDGIGDERQALVGRDGEIGRRPYDRVDQGQGRDDFRLFGLFDIDDDDLVLAGFGEDRLAGVVPVNFIVVADHQILRLGECRRPERQDRGHAATKPAHQASRHDAFLPCSPTLRAILLSSFRLPHACGGCPRQAQLSAAARTTRKIAAVRSDAKAQDRAGTARSRAGKPRQPKGRRGALTVTPRACDRQSPALRRASRVRASARGGTGRQSRGRAARSRGPSPHRNHFRASR